MITVVPSGNRWTVLINDVPTKKYFATQALAEAYAEELRNS